MKKKIIILFIIILCILSLSYIFKTVNYNRVKSNKKPILMLKIADFDDGGTKEYVGVGYKIVKCNILNGDKSIHIGGYNLKYSEVCKYENSDFEKNVKIVETKKCNRIAKLYYSDENKKIFFYCIDRITINDGNVSFDSKEQKVDEEIINYIIDNYTEAAEVSYDDGGSMIYHSNNFKVLKCHALLKDGFNTDIYIGNGNMSYSSGYCK